MSNYLAGVLTGSLLTGLAAWIGVRIRDGYRNQPATSGEAQAQSVTDRVAGLVAIKKRYDPT